MDINQALKNTENDLRDIISFRLKSLFGDNWVQQCGISQERVSKWTVKQSEDKQRLSISDQRILYYADFYDLRTIIDKNWEQGFKVIFDKKKEFEVLFSILEEYRNPEAHQRELMGYQKNLAIGISGKLRSQITSYFSKVETGQSYYPRIEYAQGSLGNSYSLNTADFTRAIKTNSKLRPGGLIEFTISAFDPLGDKILYAIDILGITELTGGFEWREGNSFSVEIEESYVGNNFWIFFYIKSTRQYHARTSIDDEVRFGYEVLPPK